MGLLSKIVGAASKGEYEKKYPQFVGANFTFDDEEYPNGTELVEEFTDELSFQVDHNAYILTHWLAKTFLEGTIGIENAAILDSILGVEELGRWLKACKPINLAMLSNGRGNKWRTMFTSPGFKKWTSKQVSVSEFYMLYNIATTELEFEDYDYINWEAAAIWDRATYKQVRMNKMLSKVGGNAGAFNEQIERDIVRLIRADKNRFYGPAEKIDLSKF